MRRVLKQATCHPDRPHRGKGLCKNCLTEEWYQRHPLYSRVKAWKRYGIDPEEAKATLEACKGICRICGRSDAKQVDHCHKTNKVRGVLCRQCNAGLGMFQDNPQLFVKALYYLFLAEEKQKKEGEEK